MKKIYPLLLLVCAASATYAQQGFGTSNPAASSVVDMVSSDKGVLLPRVSLTSTTVAAPVTSPADALTVFNTNTAGDVTLGYYYWSTAATKWMRLLNSNDAWQLKGNAGTVAGTNFLGTTDDVDLVFKRNGVVSGILDFAHNNTSFGVGALPLGVTGGQKNTAIGTQALAGNTSGLNNTVIGYQAAFSGASGTNNVAIGSGAFYGGSTGTGNMAIGNGALATAGSYYHVIAIGNGALNKLTGGALHNGENLAVGAFPILATGDGNTGLGIGSGQSQTMGNNNTYVGYGAALTQTTGDNNIAIGQFAYMPSTTGSNQLNIGNNIFGTGLNGSVASPAGQIGIGTSTPNSTLQIEGSVSASIITTNGSLDLSAGNYFTVIYTGGTSAPTFTLPDPATCKGRIYHIINASSTSNYQDITLSRQVNLYTGNSSNIVAIQTYATSSINDPVIGNTAQIQSDGVNWWRIGL